MARDPAGGRRLGTDAGDAGIRCPALDLGGIAEEERTACAQAAAGVVAAATAGGAQRVWGDTLDLRRRRFALMAVRPEEASCLDDVVRSGGVDVPGYGRVPLAMRIRARAGARLVVLTGTAGLPLDLLCTGLFAGLFRQLGVEATVLAEHCTAVSHDSSSLHRLVAHVRQPEGATPLEQCLPPALWLPGPEAALLLCFAFTMLHWPQPPALIRQAGR